MASNYQEKLPAGSEWFQWGFKEFHKVSEGFSRLHDSFIEVFKWFQKNIKPFQDVPVDFVGFQGLPRNFKAEFPAILEKFPGFSGLQRISGCPIVVVDWYRYISWRFCGLQENLKAVYVNFPRV